MSERALHLSRSSLGTTARAALAALVFVAGLTGCLATPGDVSLIQYVSTTTVDGWRYDYYRNLAYPCAVSGYQTFLVGRRVGSDDDASRPLWVKMHGGGVGWFNPDGSVSGGLPRKQEESRTSLLNRVDEGLMADVMAAHDDYRVLVVSMCSHDLYAGDDTPDPNNPNTEPDGTPVTANGLFATKAAIAHTTAAWPTDDVFLHGGSAGSAGTVHMAWALQQQGTPPAGIVADSGVLNQLWEYAQVDQDLACQRPLEGGSVFLDRIHPAIADPANQPHLLVSSGRLTVPVLHVWNKGDKNTCSNLPMSCPMPDGSSPVLWSATCVHAPLRAAIDAQGPTSRSTSIGLCVDAADTPEPCDVHVVTTKAGLVNTDPAHPADYLPVLADWVADRRLDD